jgi:UDP-N-acetylglucosamine 2-epimerase (non-hydrolysing)
MHCRAVPTGGGLAIAGGMGVAFAGLFALEGLPAPLQTVAFWLGGLVVMGGGLWDDAYDLDPKTKVGAQLVAAYLLLHTGTSLSLPGLEAGGGLERPLYVVPLSLLWVVGVTNAINLIDGLDGLAAGVAGIAALSCAVLFGIRGDVVLMGVGLGLAGAIAGFLPFNVRPASIFMGDAGSLFLGYVLAAYTLQAPLHADVGLALLLPPLLLGVPVLDTLVAMVRRGRAGRSLFAPDRSHIHHRLVERGSDWQAVWVLYGVAGAFGGAAGLVGLLPASGGYVLLLLVAGAALGWAGRLGAFAVAPSHTAVAPGHGVASEGSTEAASPLVSSGDGHGASLTAPPVPHGKGGPLLNCLSVVGARPNFMKVAPLHRALQQHGGFRSTIVHTGQHYDEQMSDVFFRQLGLPTPDLHLGVGSGSHAAQTARVMEAFEQVVQAEAPDLVLVVGDVNSTLAGALVAAKLQVDVAHVEAGLRSGDRRMPEEINRLLTDRLADYLFVTEQSGVEHLRAEGVPEEKVFFVGNLMIDALVQCREAAARRTPAEDLGVAGHPYVLMTMHRPGNVDHERGARRLLETIAGIAAERPVVFPMHPRTRARFEAFGLMKSLDALGAVHVLEPQGYLEFLRLMEEACVVVTDSGGIQEETTFLGVPCLTLRENTERPVTIEQGTNELVPLVPSRVVARVRGAAETPPERSGGRPPLWDGRAAGRIVQVLEAQLMPRGAPSASPSPSDTDAATA